MIRSFVRPLFARPLIGIAPAALLTGCGAAHGIYDVTSPDLDQKTTAVNCAPHDTVCHDALNRGYLCVGNPYKEVAAPPWENTRRVDNGERLNRSTYEQYIFVQCLEPGKEPS